MKYLFYILLGTILLSCKVEQKSTTNDTGGQGSIYWVNSIKTECTGVAPMSCMQVQKGESLDYNNWSLFYNQIDGFVYEPGYIYKLRVKEEAITSSQVPADGSSIRYSLLEQLEKMPDPRNKINDIWVLTHINGDSLGKTLKTIQLEVKIAENKVMGNDGCNNFFGSLETLTDKDIKFGLMAGTKMFCNPMETTDLYNRLLGEVSSYKVEQRNLILFNIKGKELLRYKKVD